jgi:NOL1/NOP2/fmu family ribosome biogenesis protein
VDGEQLGGAPGASRGGIPIGEGDRDALSALYEYTLALPEDPKERSIRVDSDPSRRRGWCRPDGTRTGASVGGHVSSGVAHRAEQAGARSGPVVPPLTS